MLWYNVRVQFFLCIASVGARGKNLKQLNCSQTMSVGSQDTDQDAAGGGSKIRIVFVDNSHSVCCIHSQTHTNPRKSISTYICPRKRPRANKHTHTHLTAFRVLHEAFEKLLAKRLPLLNTSAEAPSTVIPPPLLVSTLFDSISTQDLPTRAQRRRTCCGPSHAFASPHCGWIWRC